MSTLYFSERAGLLISGSKDRSMALWQVAGVEPSFDELDSEEHSSDSENQFLPHYDDRQFREMEREFRQSLETQGEGQSNLLGPRRSELRRSTHSNDPLHSPGLRQG